MLNFTAAKRTASLHDGKRKVSTKPKTSQPVTRVIKKRESEDIDEYDDIVLKDSSGEDIEEVEAEPSRVNTNEVEKEKNNSSTDDSETPPRMTRLQTKKSLPSAPTKSGKDKGSTTPQPFKISNLKLEDLQKKVEAKTIEKDNLPELDPTSKRWNELHKAAKANLGGVPIHGKNDNKVQQILKVFDNSFEYGPCIGMTRLERWERAESLGLNPPKEIYEILTTKQGQALDEYKQSVFHGEV